jgi:hypothetical protein
MDQIKEAFRKVKVEMDFLKEELDLIKEEITQVKESIFIFNNSLNNILSNLQKNSNKNSLTEKINRDFNLNLIKTDTKNIRTETNINTTDNTTENKTDIKILPFKDLKKAFFINSTGNKGVSTDRQTDKQTDNSTDFSTGNKGVINIPFNELIPNTSSILNNNINSQIPNNPLRVIDSSQVLDKLDALKDNLKYVLKSLTKREMLVLLSIYQFEEQGEIVDYSFLSSKLSISESSIRDYVQRLTFKGIPLTKEKINNKRIILKIPLDFKRLASLNTLISFKEL